MIEQYGTWLKKSQAVFLLEYKGMAMKDIDNLRAKAREAGGEMHVVKNTLFEMALKGAGYDQPKDYTEGSTVVGFAFNDAPALAKMISDSTKNTETFKVKGGFLAHKPMSKSEVKALGDLPPLPIMRAMLLGTLLAPASKLVRTLAEPGRSIAAVIQAHSDQAAQPAVAEAE
jgi:large subunit ribosomal protein L10